MLKSNCKMLVQHAARVLRDVWDPIGLDGEGPENKYDSYVPDVFALVRDTTMGEPEIIAHLLRIATKEMRLAEPPTRTVRAGRALLGLREASGRAPDLLVTQTVSDDGLHYLWVFRRPDSLFFYEQAALRHDTDVNGTFSWWDAAGQRRSGLFDSAEAATEEAHATIEWLR